MSYRTVITPYPGETFSDADYAALVVDLTIAKYSASVDRIEEELIILGSSPPPADVARTISSYGKCQTTKIE